MRVAVGVDAGGSSTVVGVSHDAAFIRKTVGPAANPTSLGVKAASDAIATTIFAALDGVPPNAIVVGAAGAGRGEVARDMTAALQSRFSGATVEVSDDAHIALRAAIPQGPGAVLIAGTGSIAYALWEGESYRSGGYGYLLGDDGSGFAIGAATAKALLRHYDGRAPRDEFIDAIETALDARSPLDVLARMYGSPNPVTSVASLAPVAIESANRGSRSAGKIVQGAALELAELVKSLVKRAGMSPSSAPIVLAGGLLESNSMLTFLLETRLQNDLPSMPIVKSACEPFAGALAAAERRLHP
ncbi:MAG: hypothetical protein M3M96_07715 [Candidatus Eremiobacteraeota bacterium]|nr:hypothetical protein [Candidatus Eremiobacteraeota bacterium]